MPLRAVPLNSGGAGAGGACLFGWWAHLRPGGVPHMVRTRKPGGDAGACPGKLNNAGWPRRFWLWAWPSGPPWRRAVRPVRQPDGGQWPGNACQGSAASGLEKGGEAWARPSAERAADPPPEPTAELGPAQRRGADGLLMGRIARDLGEGGEGTRLTPWWPGGACPGAGLLGAGGAVLSVGECCHSMQPSIEPKLARSTTHGRSRTGKTALTAAWADCASGGGGGRHGGGFARRRGTAGRGRAEEDRPGLDARMPEMPRGCGGLLRGRVVEGALPASLET